MCEFCTLCIILPLQILCHQLVLQLSAYTPPILGASLSNAAGAPVEILDTGGSQI